MSIKIIEEPTIHVTAGELRRFQEEYRKFLGHYCGAPPTLEEFIRSQQRSAESKGAK